MASSRVRAARFARRNSIGLLALFIALGGTSYAAATLPKNSVGSNQIQPRAVSSSDIKSGAVTSSKIKSNAVISTKIQDGAVQGVDIKDGSVSAAKLGKAPAVRAVLPTGVLQTVTSGTNAGALFPSTAYNNDGKFSVSTNSSGGTSFVAPVSGVYAISGQVNWFDPALGTTPRQDNGDGARSLFINGPQGAIYASSTTPGVALDFTRQSVATTTYLAAGSEIFLSTAQSSGVDLQIRGSLQQVSFSATLLSS